MKATAEIDAGICGFRTVAGLTSEDYQNVTFNIQTDCEKVRNLAELIKEKAPVDAFQEIHLGADGVVLTASRSALKGCCAACAVPVGIFKAMQVCAGLALPKDIAIKIAKE